MSKLKNLTIRNTNNIGLTVLNYGGIIQALTTPSNKNLVLGYEQPEQYVNNNPCYLGAIVGRLANRVVNGHYIIEQQQYQLQQNEKQRHCLHSGTTGLHNVYWDMDGTTDKITLHYYSPDGEGGFNANVDINVEYQLTNDDELIITYRATSDAATPLDLTNHSYWNLNGGDSVLQHECLFFAEDYLPTSHEMIPSGEIISVHDTALDFTLWKTIGHDIKQLAATQGYDHYLLATQNNKTLKQLAHIKSTTTNYELMIASTELGFQFYSGQFLAEPYTGFCIETQNYPNAINQANFPSPIITPENPYYQRTVYKLKV